MRHARSFGLASFAALIGLAVPITLAGGCSSLSKGPDAAVDGGVTSPSSPASTSATEAGAAGDAADAADAADALPDAGRADGAPPDAASSDAAGPDAGSPDAAPPIELAPYRIIGRFDSRDPAGPRFGWPGTEVRARFGGTSISVDLGDTGASQYEWAVDGAPKVRLVIGGPRKTYTLATDLPKGEHELVLTKRTESFVGVTQLFAINAPLVGTPPASARRIELVGDSITCGYGVLGADASCPFSADTESEPLAWGALAAHQLGAAHTAIAWSGIGVLRNYDLTTSGTMPERYGRALASDPTSAWPPSDFEPAVIVVNLGTNDFAGAGTDPGTPFETKLVAFLEVVRAAHANAHVVLATSPMLSGERHVAHRAHLQKAITARSAAGDTKLSLLELDVPPASEGFGCDSHPSAATQKTMATKLVAHVKTLTGW